jgi:polysaccharide pyruvyl transferase WcaK-like protein
MSHIVLFDPAVLSRNLGDQIISETIRSLLRSTVPEVRVLTSTTQQAPGWKSAMLARNSLLNIVGGSNCFTPHRLHYSMWKIGLPALVRRVRYLLMGVGSYGENAPDPYSAMLYRSVLSRTLVHSCRDAATTSRIRHLGLQAVNTGCPTMWGLDEVHCRRIPINRSEHVIFTLTDYLQDHQADLSMIQTLRDTYQQRAFWPQGLGDLAYLRHLLSGSLDGIRILDPQLESFESHLDSVPCDYVGTRLHAGIKALQHARRALVIGIDHRARAIAADTALPTLPRGQLARLGSTLSRPGPIRIRMPWHGIREWQDQLKRLARSGAQPGQA